MSSPLDFALSQTLVALAATTSAVLVSTSLVYRHLTARRDRLPQVDPSVPRIKGADTFLGVFGELDTTQVFLFNKTCVETFGSPSMSHFMGRPVIYVGLPDQVKDVVTAVKEKAPKVKEAVSSFLGEEAIITLPHERWQPLRKTLGRVFHLSNMKGYFAVFVDASRDFVARVEEHNSRRKTYFEGASAGGLRTRPSTLLQPMDVDKCAMDLALDIVTRALFSRDLEIQRGQESELSVKIGRITHYVVKIALNPVFWLLHPFQYAEYKRLVRWYHGIFLAWIRERQADPNHENKDLLGLMLKSRDPDTGAALTTQEILAQCTTFYFAGHDTTAHTIAWALYEIARHPEIEGKVYEELCEVIGDKDAPSYEEGNKLTYLQWVVKETLRMHPPAGGFSRHTTEPTEIAGVKVPAGTTAIVSILAIHNSELVWPEPWRFRPERFSPEESEGRDPQAWIPFSVGERNCIGMNFALAEIRVVLAVLCKKYRLAPSVDLLPHTAMFITQAPVDGIHVHFLPRDE